MTTGFTEKHAQWYQALHGNDRNAIFQQLFSMTWDAAAFRVINEARRLAEPAQEGGIQASHLLHNLLNRCFFQSQLLVIRRLTANEGLSGERGTFSLRAVVEDMKQNLALLTRQNLLEAKQCPLDLAEVNQREEEYHREQLNLGTSVYSVPPEIDCDRFERMHCDVDVICGTTPANRQPTDMVMAIIFDNMIQRLTGIGADVKTWVDKFIAHCATPASRAITNADDIKLTLTHIWKAHEVLCRIAQVLDRYFFLGACREYLPFVDDEILKHLDRSLVRSENLTALEQRWQCFANETQSWGQTELEWITA